VKLIGLMLARNEQWVIGCSLRAALEWCDAVVVINHASVDDTGKVILDCAFESNGRVIAHRVDDTGQWDEMYIRQKSLEIGRKAGGTHFAIIDCDEVLTANNLPWVRHWFEELKEGEVIDVPMIAPWKSLDCYSLHTRGVITLGWKDKPDMGWAPRGDEKYHYHNRPPHGLTKRSVPENIMGGVFHLQWASEQRVIWKHRHYMMCERIRWGYPVNEINEKYHWWTQPPHGSNLEVVPRSWWGGHDRSKILLNDDSWYEAECFKMVARHGVDAFAGLDLFGWTANVA
jgi:hypothetical protein